MATGRNSGGRHWGFRRRLVICTLAFDAITVLICLMRDIPPAVADTAISSAFASGMAVIGSYVFAATWSDKK